LGRPSFLYCFIVTQGVREQKAKRFEGKESFKSSEEKKDFVYFHGNYKFIENKYLGFYESDRVSPENRHELSDDDIIDDKSH
jgi:hypothetical protein